MNSITVEDGAERVAVNCGVDTCTGTLLYYYSAIHPCILWNKMNVALRRRHAGVWDWSSLEVTGGSAGPINNFTSIVGFSQ